MTLTISINQIHQSLLTVLCWTGVRYRLTVGASGFPRSDQCHKSFPSRSKTGGVILRSRGISWTRETWDLEDDPRRSPAMASSTGSTNSWLLRSFRQAVDSPAKCPRSCLRWNYEAIWNDHQIYCTYIYIYRWHHHAIYTLAWIWTIFYCLLTSWIGYMKCRRRENTAYHCIFKTSPKERLELLATVTGFKARTYIQEFSRRS